MARYNADLANNLGNLVSRVTTVVHSKCGGVGPGCNAAQRARAAWRPPCSMRRRRPGPAGRRTRRSKRRGGSSARPTRSSSRPSPGRWSPDPPSTRYSATRSRSCASWRVLIAPAMPSTAVEVWRRIGVVGDPSLGTAPGGRRVGRLHRRRGRREGGAPVPAAQGLTLAGWFDSHCHVQEEYLPGTRSRGDGPAARPGPGGRGRHRPAGLHRHGASPPRSRRWRWRGRRPARGRARGPGRPSGCTRTRRVRASTRWRRCWRVSSRRTTVRWWRSGSAGWTTTTSTRRATRNARRSRRRSRWRTPTGSRW